MRAVTLYDVARRAGVSQPTASRVLNGSTRTPGPQVVEQVRRAAAELGYVANAHAQALARATTGLLGLVVPEISDPYFSEIAASIQLAAERRSRQVMLATTNRDPDRQTAAVDSFISYRADAIILVGSRISGPKADHSRRDMVTRLAGFTANGGRVAAIGQRLQHAAALVLGDAAGARALVTALISQGHRRFVILAGPRNVVTAAHRTSGFLAGIKGHPDIPAAQVVRCSFDRDGGYDSVQRLITDGIVDGRPLCILATSDMMAIGAVAALQQAGLKLPRDVQISGYDDIPTLRDYSPRLTTVRLPLEEMGTWVTALALDEHRTPGSTRVELVPGEVVIRESTQLIT